MSASAAVLNPTPRIGSDAKHSGHMKPELSVVSSTRPRTSGALTIAILLAGALSLVVTSLGISTYLASGALGMGKLQTELKVLQEQNEAYVDQLNELSSVHVLSQRAQELGMVANPRTGFINLETKTVDDGRKKR